ncbi:MAG TPA: D-2-hydroxyacid dehydrogenase [Terriglobales bacterium]|jgi:D-2-hydroxyacid dehydrogenase (NADP+)|nr:D-2-hydroxyacid dehydrogenase [Terriglobales bacterium]
MTSLLSVLAIPPDIASYYDSRLRTAFPQLTINLVDHHSKVGPYIGSADILMTFGPMINDQVVREATNLKWIQALGTGVDNLVDLPSLRSDVMVTNLQGIHGAPMSEAAIMAMLALSRDLPRVVRNQDRHLWERWPASLLEGKKLGILGIGVIAEALAPKCKALGMTVVGITSTKRTVTGFDRVFGRDELLIAVRDVDYLVALTAYSPATHHIVNAAVLSAMKPGGYFINLARGGIVDEEALIKALESRSIAGAALDVFNHEPLPDDHPFWTMKNVIVTPHLGGFYDGYADRALPVVEENIRRFLAGDTMNMINVVRR